MKVRYIHCLVSKDNLVSCIPAYFGVTVVGTSESVWKEFGSAVAFQQTCKLRLKTIYFRSPC